MLLTSDLVVSSSINGCFVFIFVLGNNYILHVWEISAIEIIRVSILKLILI